MNPFARAFFVLVRDPEGFGGDFAAFEKGLGELVSDAGIDAEFVHDEAMDNSRAGEGGGGEENAERGVGANQEELGELGNYLRRVDGSLRSYRDCPTFPWYP